MSIFFGSYPYERDGTLRPIEWEVFGRDSSDRRLLLSKNIIDVLPFHDYFRGSWSKCSLRKYLNGPFLDFFTEEEKEQIIPVEVEDYVWVDLYSTWEPTIVSEHSAGPADRVFILCLMMNRGGAFIDPSEQILRYGECASSWNMSFLTPYAAAKAEEEDGAGYPWWLRAVSTMDGRIYLLEDSCDFLNEWPMPGRPCDYAIEEYGIRPALWIRA